jgi:hypothetical protein
MAPEVHEFMAIRESKFSVDHFERRCFQHAECASSTKSNSQISTCPQTVTLLRQGGKITS